MAFRTIIPVYFKFVFHSLRVVSALIIAVNGLIAAIAALDLAFNLGFGYPWWSLLVCALAVLVACGTRRFASWQLREISRGNRTIFDPRIFMK